MKAQLSEAYYRENWDRFLEPVPGKHHINLEKQLTEETQVFIEAGLPEKAIEVIRMMKAKEVADACKKLVMDEMQVIKRIETGKASFGYTTERQEIEARHEFRCRFEFNCLQLADFRKKYGLE